MSSEVKRYDAVHLRYECNNIRYGEGCEVEVVTASDYAALEAECAELDALRERQSYLLSQTAIALRGPEPALTRYSHADIPSRVYLVVAERDALAAELEALKAPCSEAPEVVAWRHWGDATKLLPELGKQRAIPGGYADEFTIPLMTTSQHERILASWQRAQSAPVAPEGERLADLLESVWMGDDEAKPHGIGATYWNNAVIACKVAIRDAIAAAPQPAPQQGDELLDGAQAFKDELLKATRSILHPHIEGVFAVFQQQRTALSAQGEGERT